MQFEEFYEIAIKWLQGSKSAQAKYEIIDQQTFKSLLHTFYFVAMKEMGNILKKRESDERFAISQLTEKALAKHNRSKKHYAKGSWSSGLTANSFESKSTKISHTSQLKLASQSFP